MIKEIIIEWVFEPGTFFESKIIIDEADYTLEIFNGRIAAKLKDLGKVDPNDIKEAVLERIKDIFNVRQIIHRLPYKIQGGSITRYHENGSKDIAICVESAVVVVCGFGADFIQKDAKGNIIYDSKTERIKNDSGFIDRIVSAIKKDPFVKVLLSSYHNSISFPENELLYLYEIREALLNKFGSKKKAISKLGITESRWDFIGKLSNKEPVEQSRHRGKHVVRRPLTEEEIREARIISRELIELFIKTI